MMLKIDVVDDLMEELQDRVSSIYYAWQGYQNDLYVTRPKHAKNLKTEILKIETIVKGLKDIITVEIKE